MKNLYKNYQKIVKNVYINKNDIVIDRAIWDVAEQGKWMAMMNLLIIQKSMLRA